MMLRSDAENVFRIPGVMRARCEVASGPTCFGINDQSICRLVRRPMPTPPTLPETAPAPAAKCGTAGNKLGPLRCL